MPVLLSDEELQAMQELPHLHRCLYIFGIRRYMDYQTGITGIKRKISYKSLSEEVYVAQHQGVNDSGAKSIAQLKRAVKVLEKAGLISFHSKITKCEKQLILECVLAQRDKSVQNKPVPHPYHSPVPKAVPSGQEGEAVKQDVLDDFKNKTRTESRTSKNEKAVPHPVSGICKLSKYVCKSYPQEELRQLYIDMLQTRNYAPGGMHHVETGAMLTVWVSKGVTAEDVRDGILAGEAKIEGVPKYPFFYKNFVIAAMKARLRAEEEISKPMITERQAKPRKDEFQALKEKWMANLAGTEFEGDLNAYAKK